MLPDRHEIRCLEVLQQSVQAPLPQHVLATRAAEGEVEEDGPLEGLEVTKRHFDGGRIADDADLGRGGGLRLRKVFKLSRHRVGRDIEHVGHDAPPGHHVGGADGEAPSPERLRGEKIGVQPPGNAWVERPHEDRRKRHQIEKPVDRRTETLPFNECPPETFSFEAYISLFSRPP